MYLWYVLWNPKYLWHTEQKDFVRTECSINELALNIFIFNCVKTAARKQDYLDLKGFNKPDLLFKPLSATEQGEGGQRHQVQLPRRCARAVPSSRVFQYLRSGWYHRTFLALGSDTKRLWPQSGILWLKGIEFSQKYWAFL